jgi:hypothetical protein
MIAMPSFAKIDSIRTLIISVLLSSLCVSAIAETEREEEVLDLNYGLTLYHLFQDKYFSAITDLLIAKKRKPIVAQGNSPELLLGGLLLDYGIEQDASTIFNRLLDEHAPPAIRDLSWFHLSQIQYKAGNLSAARGNLNRIGETLSEYRNAERLHLLSNIYIEQQQYDEAMSTLQLIPKKSIFVAYTQFNIGVTLIKENRLDDGVALLQSLIKNEATTEELAALHDKAYIAIGSAFMRVEQYQKAAEQFKKVRLNSPQSDIGLLGLGWAYYKQSLYEKALIPWLELNSSLVISPAMQESLLVAPHTFELVELPQQAVSHYSKALATYDRQLADIREIITAINKNELLRSITPTTNIGEEKPFFHYRAELPESIATKYLMELMASQEFQHAIKNYQELHYLQGLLQHWEENLPTYTLMIEERRQRYTQKSPLIKDSAQLKQVAQYEILQKQFSAEVAQGISSNNILSLASTEERELLEILRSVREKLDRLSGKEDVSEQQKKYELLYGLLYWQISADAIPRQWQLQKGLKELGDALTKAKDLEQSLQQAWIDAPRRFNGFAAQIKEKSIKVRALLQQTARLKAEQGMQINALALTAIERYRVINTKNQSHATFALARLYDTLKKTEDK